MASLQRAGVCTTEHVHSTMAKLSTELHARACTGAGAGAGAALTELLADGEATAVAVSARKAPAG